MVRELGTALDTLRTARNKAYEKEKSDLCQRLKDSEQSVDMLRMEIDNAEYGVLLPWFNKEKVETAHLDKMIDFEKTLHSMLKDIAHEASEVGRAVSEDNREAERAADKLNRTTKRIKDKFQERKDYLTGIA